jgi:RHS repeat-associated protein
MRTRIGVSLVLVGSAALFSMRLWLPGAAISEASLRGGGAPTGRSGETVTMLPNGETLTVGGEGATGPTADAAVSDPNSGRMGAVGALTHPRAGHSATVLPDGTVLIFGGIGPGGRLVQESELFDPARGVFEPVAVAVAPRALHTATLLLDGRVLIAGGVGDDGAPLASIVLWDTQTGAVSPFAEQLATARYGQTATTLPNGVIVLSGGTGLSGATLLDTECIDIDAGRVMPGGAFVLPPTVGATELMASLPADGATDVPTTGRLGLRFSIPVQVGMLSPETISLVGRDGAVTGTVIAAENGSLVFMTPTAPLAPGAHYRLGLRGMRDANGSPMADTTITFTTARKGGGGAGDTAAPLSSSSASQPSDTVPIEDEQWAPDPRFPFGNWRTGRAKSAWETLPPLQAASGTTALAGQVLALNGQPIPGVTLEMDGQTARTDATGRFVLVAAKAGHCELLIDGGDTHGVFEVGVDVVAARTTVLPYTIWLPRIDLVHAVTIPSPTLEEVVVTTPLIPGLELHIPPGTVIRDHAGKVVRRVSLTPIPLDRPPFPLPTGVNVPLFFTAQPGAAYLQVPTGSDGARLIYPNSAGEPPGWPFNFWNYDAEDSGWYVYGQGEVTPDRTQIVPNPGVVVYEFTGAMVAQDGPPGTGSTSDGEPVDLLTGAFIYKQTDLVLPDVIPISLARTYQSSDAWTYRGFGVGFTNNYDYLLVGNFGCTSNCSYDPLYLILPGGQRIQFNRTMGSGFGGTWAAAPTPTSFAGALLRNNWQITTRDGMTYSFPDCGATQLPNSCALRSIADRYGNTVTLTRDGSGNLTKIVSPHGRSISLAYEAVPGSTNPTQYRVTAATDNIGRQVRYTYTATNQLQTVQDAKSVQNNTPSVVTRYTYGASGCRRMTQIQDARGITYLTNEYYETVPSPQTATLCAVKNQTLSGYPAYHFDYDEIDLLCCQGCTCGPLPPPYIADTTVTDPRGTVRHVVFDQTIPTMGFPVSDTRAQGQPEEQTITYNDGRYNSGRISAVTDALNRKTAFTYDSRENITSITRMAGAPEAQTTTFTYEYPPMPPSLQSPFTYSRLTSISKPGLPATTLNYYSSGPETGFGFNVGNQVVTTDPTGVQTTLSLTTEGLPAATTNGVGRSVQFGYEGGDLTTITDPLGNVTRRVYDQAGRVRLVIDPRGMRTAYDYDALNNLTQITDPANGIVTFGYDEDSNLTSVTDKRVRTNASATVYAYDTFNRLSRRTDPLGRYETFQDYDFAGSVGTYTNRRGKVTALKYDRLERLTFVGFDKTGTGMIVTYGSQTNFTDYDKANRLLKLTDSLAGTILRAYDDFDHPTCESAGTALPCTSSQPKAVSYTYDGSGRRQTMTVGGQTPVCYGYDNVDRLTALMLGSCTASPAVTIQYDGAGRRSYVKLPNNVSETYGYTDASLLSSIQAKNESNGNVLGGLTYTYDGAGNVTDLGGGSARVALPAITTAQATYDDANQLLAWNGMTLSPTPDANGNLQSDGTYTYVWNARNQLDNIKSGATVVANFIYDGFGRRSRKVQSGTTTDYTYDGMNPVSEAIGSNPATTLLTGLGIDDYFTRTAALGTRSILSDALGSVIALTDTSGAVQTTYTYEPFGKTTVSGPDSGSNANPFAFTGRENDGTGLLYYRARYYTPTFGRFISEDPLNLASTQVPRSSARYGRMLPILQQPERLNAYNYVGNRPSTQRDPLGLFWGGVILPPNMGGGPLSGPFGGGFGGGGTSAECRNPCQEGAESRLSMCELVLGGTVATGSGLTVGACVFAGPGMPLCIEVSEGAMLGPEAAAMIACRQQYYEDLKACGP